MKTTHFRRIDHTFNGNIKKVERGYSGVNQKFKSLGKEIRNVQ